MTELNPNPQKNSCGSSPSTKRRRGEGGGVPYSSPLLQPSTHPEGGGGHFHPQPQIKKKKMKPAHYLAQRLQTAAAQSSQQNSYAAFAWSGVMEQDERLTVIVERHSPTKATRGGNSTGRSVREYHIPAAEGGHREKKLMERKRKEGSGQRESPLSKGPQKVI